jgi:GDPmannose 4,6-dehydratase
MLQQQTPKDYVIATGHQYSVRDFVDSAAACLEMKLDWEGEGEQERALDAKGRVVVSVDPRYFRPTEVETLLGDPSKAHRELGWKPQTTFQRMVAEMIEHDLLEAKRDSLVEKHGFNSYQYHES